MLDSDAGVKSDQDGGEEGSICYVVEQFVTEVLDFSSQYGSDSSISYTAHNIVGRPTKFPSYGDFSQTFVMRDYGPWWTDCPSGKVWRCPLNSPKPSHLPRATNFIDIKFEHAVYPFRIHVYETYNPGGLVCLWAGDCQGNWTLLWSSVSNSGPSPSPVSQQPRQFSPPIQPTDFPTRLIRMEFDQSSLQYYTEVDAVCLIGTQNPISLTAKVAALLPTTLSPILNTIVKRKLHILSQEPGAVLRACEKQLSRPALNKFIRDTIRRERSPPIPDNGLFEQLPKELVLSILSYLDLGSLSRVARVCTTWRDLVKDPFLYQIVDLRQMFHLTTSLTLTWLMSRCEKMTQLDMSWCGNYGAISRISLTTFLLTLGHQLTVLRLDNCHVATLLVLDTIASNCHSLLDLSLANCHLLKPTDFHSLGQLETLVSLNLYRTSVNQPSIISILCSNRQLEHLNLSACSNILGDEVCMVLSCCQPRLSCLDLWRCSNLTSRGVTALASCSRLTDLDLGWCLNVQASSGALVVLVESCLDLVRLHLTAHRQTSDRELSVLSRLTKLEQLDILGNRNVSLSAVTELLANVHSLKLLDISFCEQLGETNIAQLRHQYPGVNIKWSFTDVG